MIAFVLAALQTLTSPVAPQAQPKHAPVAPPQPQVLAPAQPPAPAPAEPKKSAPPYEGTLRAGRLELAQLSKANKSDGVSALCQRLDSKLAAEIAPEGEQAETLYAIGVAQSRAGAVEEAVDAFHRCRGLAGSSELGRDALYDSGTSILLVAEDLRLAIPEIREKLKLPAQPAPSAGPQPPGGAQQGPDPLDVAQQAYLASRGELVERWKSGPSDADTRANLELIQRRLRELDELRNKREEQKKQQEQQQQQDQQKDQQKDDQKQDPSKQDQQKKQDQQGKDSKDQRQQDAKQDQPKDQQQDQQQQPQPGEDQKDQPKDEPKSGADPAKPREAMVLTPEEMQRLFDQLAQIEERAQQVQAMLRERRRTPVKKDW